MKNGFLYFLSILVIVIALIDGKLFLKSQEGAEAQISNNEKGQIITTNPSLNLEVNENKNEPNNKITTLNEENTPKISLYDEALSLLVSEKNNFIEVNFEDKKTRLWENGEVYKEFSIIATGDPDGWGGTPAGRYSVISKNEERYSSASNVYMPNAVGFYGKYFLHGEPYYQSGEKRFTDATGGCVQYKDDDSKEIYDFAKHGMPILIIDKKNNFTLEKYPPEEQLEISAPNYLVADLDSGIILKEKNSKDKRPMASITKLMEAVVVTENIDLRNDILVQDFMLDGYGETNGLTDGKRFRLVELLYPLLIESSNDAAQILSYFLGRIRTIELMNAKAKNLLMEDTNFADASGFNPANISTAEDIFRLTRYIALNRPPIFQITKGREVRAYGEVRFSDLKNKNIFFEYPDFVGGKTGYIVSSMYTGTFIFKMPINGKERNIAIVLLGSKNLEQGKENIHQDVFNILNWVKNNNSNIEIVRKS
ncbi:MAG: hypothetical protein EXS49_02205 [Candidatus Pacebacteria bacterium]|nr:hypothetical protein [Candidatus Paceibacterota bacterium]